MTDRSRSYTTQMESDSAHSSSPSRASSEASDSDCAQHGGVTYNLKDQLKVLQLIQNDDLTDEKGINALPRRKPKSQRPLATKLAQALFPSLTDLAALIQYEVLVNSARKAVREQARSRLAAEQAPKNNMGGRLLKIQGPWAGQALDPVDLKGPSAIPMPVEVGPAKAFEPIFSFLAGDESFHDAYASAGIHSTRKSGFELTWKNPTLEFDRGIVYEDGRLDLCKKVVGPTHVQNLMNSLETNHHIKQFLLGNNVISTTGAHAISEFIEKYPDRIETWYIAGCHITYHGLSLLVPSMIKSPAITNLWFKRNPLGAKSSKLLAQLVLNMSHLRTLDLETVELGDEGKSSRRYNFKYHIDVLDQVVLMASYKAPILVHCLFEEAVHLRMIY
jgi:hypothetical protein